MHDDDSRDFETKVIQFYLISLIKNCLTNCNEKVMCIKAGNDELDSVKALMTMSLNALIAEVFDKDPEDLELSLSLTGDLGMNSEKQQELEQLIDEYFDGLSIDFSENDSLEALFQTVVNSEFEIVSR